MAEEFKLQMLGYVSRTTADMSPNDLAHLQLQASHLNALDGVTGLLLYTGSHFVQVVEGSEAALSGLVERLKQDRRHTDFHVHFSRPIDSRTFPSFDMKTIALSHDQETALEEFQKFHPGQMDVILINEIRDLLTTCYA